MEKLETHLNNWSTNDPRREAVAKTVLAIAGASTALGRHISRAPLANPSTPTGINNGILNCINGVCKSDLIAVAKDLFCQALTDAPVAVMACDIDTDNPATPDRTDNITQILDKTAPHAVLINPLVGGSNIAVNNSVGAIFSVLPTDKIKDGNIAAALVQSGRNQLAAGFFVFGPQTTLVLTLGQGTSIFTFDPDSAKFILSTANVTIPACRQEYAINASNYLHWDAPIRAYIDDCIAEDPITNEIKFDMRWVACLAAEAHRIMILGGIYLSPRDGRAGYINGRQRLAFEANPIALLIEQAGGLATDGRRNILDIEPGHLDEHIPLIFGSSQIVERVIDYHTDRNSMTSRAPLFAQRGLFRT